jgi:hypothetical protein
MNLPDLPKTHKKKEANFGIQLRHIIDTLNLDSCSIEIKHTRGKNSFPFDELTDQQISWGLKNKTGSLIRVQGVCGEPDYVWLKNTPAYVIIKYPEGIVVIPLDSFLKEKNSSSRKSLTYQRALCIACLNVT